MTTNFPSWLAEIGRKRIGNTQSAYAMAPYIYRAVNIRANALSSVPFRLMRRGNEVEWPWATDLQALIQQTERSLLITGGAYWVRQVQGRVLRGFDYVNPTTVNVIDTMQRKNVFNPISGAVFTITSAGSMIGPLSLDQVVYFREYTQNDDAQPGVAAAAVALKSAELGWYLDAFTSAFFSGGAQPVTIVNLPESTGDEEMERISMQTELRTSSWDRAFKWLFVRSPEFKVEKLTPDINSMMMPELYQRVVSNVSMAFDIPLTMLTANAANYATASSDRIGFYQETIIPRCVMYQRIINEQVMAPLGYELEFLPEQLSVMQTDETIRAGAFLQYTQGGIPPRVAAKILGIDGVDEYWPDDPTPPALPAPTPTTEPASPPALPDTTPPQPDTATRSVDWALLAKKIERRIKAGKTPQCNFDSAVISADEVKSVMARLYDGITVHEALHAVEEVKAVDDLTPEERRIYDRIITPMQKRGDAWAKQILQGKDPDAAMNDIMAPVLNDELGAAVRRRVDRLGTQFAYPMDTVDERTLDWLNDYVPALNVELNATSTNIIKKVIDQYRITPGMTIDDVRKALSPAVDRGRASAIAITEITRASSHATIEYQTYLASKGVLMERVWNTDQDELVCPICSPLQRKGEDEWIMEYPSGPPAHVRCRCDTTLRLVKD